MFDDDLSIGRFSGATGAVVIAGGQLITTNQPIWAGREGFGQLTVSNGSVRGTSLLVAAVPTNTASGAFTLAGGSVILSSNLTLGDASISTGRVAILAGSLCITNPNNTANLLLASGPLSMANGTVAVDNLIMTNSGGQFLFRGGTVRTRSSSVANGLPFTVGDGTNAATVELVGGRTGLIRKVRGSSRRTCRLPDWARTLIDRLGHARRPAPDLAGGDVELAAVPGASQAALFQVAFGQWSAAVAATIGEYPRQAL